jgi:lysophospholipase L1-like esterase
MLEMVTNSWGMRSPEIEVPKRRIRVLLIGESSTMGAGVAQWDTYATRLQQQLDKKAPDHFEVVNAGIGAWTLWQSWVLIKHYGEELSPDVVIAYHQHNDFLPRGVLDSHNYLYAVSSTDREMYERRQPIAPMLGILLQSRAYLRLRKEILLKSPGQVLGTANVTGGTRVPEADRREAWEQIVGWCAQHHSALIVVKPLYQRNFDQEDRLLPEIISRHQLPWLDVPSLAAQRGYNQGNFLLDGIHPNPIGHAIIAEGLATLVLQQKPL